jgi:hypothetical protein
MPHRDAEVYSALERALTPLGLRWYVFGAQAAILYGAVRLTEDIDITIDPRDLPTRTIVESLRRAGFALRVDDAERFVEQTRVLPCVHQPTETPVDVVLSGPGLEERFHDRARRLDVAGQAVPVAAAEDIIVMKVLAGRAKDLDDVVAILAARGKATNLDLVRDTLRMVEQALDQSDLLPQFEQCLAKIPI